LLESDATPQTLTQKESTGQILQAGWYLLNLINEILDLALVESGKLSLSLEPMSLGEVMLDCQTMIEPQAQKYGVSMSFCPNGEPLLCACRSDTGEADSHQPALQRDQVHHAGGTVVVKYAVASRDESALALQTPARDFLRKSWRSFSSRSIVSVRRPVAKRARHRLGDDQATG